VAEAPDIFHVLDELGIEYEKHEHEAVFTVEEADKHRGRLTGGQTKNLFLRNKKGNRHYLLVAEAHKKVDLKLVRERIGERGLSFASPSRLEAHLGLEPGAVSPFGIINDRNKEVMVVIDEDVLRHETLGFHPNVNTATIIIRTDDFRLFLEHCGNEIRIVSLGR
jgi:Ala-tRNA(Pro) deacylase